MLTAFVHLPETSVNRASSAAKLENVSDPMKVTGKSKERWVKKGA
jgi:hypothetical protein